MNRPYSLEELQDLEKDLYVKHRLSDIVAIHMPCLHKYRAKKGGRKEQFLLDNGPVLDDQTCSVCFKLRTVGNEDVSEVMKDQPLSREYLKRLDSFYKWLYRHEYA